jgi:hypothetical protein
VSKYIKEKKNQKSGYVFLYHIFREKNQSVDFFAELGASSDANFLTHDSPPQGIHNLLKNDVI